jgi:Flp pilus assembly protein TadD
MGFGEISAAHADLSAALAELNRRLESPRPDPGLLADRALAHALLSETPFARRDFAEAKRLGADPAALRRLEVILAAHH